MTFLISVKKTLLIIAIVPVIIIGSSYVFYGEAFDDYFSEHQFELNYYQLNENYKVFNSDIQIPNVVKDIASDSLGLLYLLFGLWIILHLVTSYFKLSRNIDSKIAMTAESLVIFLIYIYLIMPGLSIWITTIGGVLIISNLILILLYWRYEKLARNEK